MCPWRRVLCSCVRTPSGLLFALWNKRAGAVHTHSALYGTFTAHRSELLSRFIVPGGERSLKASAAPQPESSPGHNEASGRAHLHVSFQRRWTGRGNPRHASSSLWSSLCFRTLLSRSTLHIFTSHYKLFLPLETGVACTSTYGERSSRLTFHATPTLWAVPCIPVSRCSSSDL